MSKHRVTNGPLRRGQLAVRAQHREWSDPVFHAVAHEMCDYEPFTILGRVYFARDTESGHVKIGLTGNLRRRMQQLSSVRGHPVELLGAMHGGHDLEKAMHSRFREHRVEGREWFSAVILPEVLDILTEPGQKSAAA